jgi:hypothetical protein
MSPILCRAPKGKTLADIFGERCDHPASFRDSLGRPLCEACARHAKKVDQDGETILSMCGRPILICTIN